MELKAFFLNCTLKPSSEVSNTKALIDLVAGFMKEYEPDIRIESDRFTDYNIKFGIANDMGDGDQWPHVLAKIQACDIFVLCMPIWMGVRSSVSQIVIERLDGTTKVVAEGDFGQFQLYNKVAGVIVTGNEDGAHDCAANTLFIGVIRRSPDIQMRPPPSGLRRTDVEFSTRVARSAARSLPGAAIWQ